MSSGKKASDVWRLFNGLLCLFKPGGKSSAQLKTDIQSIACRGLKNMLADPPRKIVRIDWSQGEPMHVVDIDYSDHPLVIGPQYIKEDVKVFSANEIGELASGVCVIGVNDGVQSARELRESKPLEVFHVSGKLGISTINYFTDGKVVERATYSHVFRPVMDKIVATMQANQQRSMFIQCGVPLQSQAAYDLAVKGLIRSGNDNIPTIYGLKCIQFERPFFTIEVACMNVSELFLLELIHDIGIKCRTVATCTKLKCVRFGPFSLHHALLRHSWNIDSFVANIKECNIVDQKDIHSARRQSGQLKALHKIENLADENRAIGTYHDKV